MRKEPLEHVGNVARTARRRIVAGVAYEKGTGARGEAARDAPVRIASGDAECEIAARVPVVLGQSVRFAHDPLGVCPGHDDGGTAAWLVSPRVSDPHGSIDDSGPLLDLRKTGIDAARRLVPGAGAFA